MAKITIQDLPQEMKLSKKKMEMISGGLFILPVLWTGSMANKNAVTNRYSDLQFGLSLCNNLPSRHDTSAGDVTKRGGSSKDALSQNIKG